MTDRFRDIAMIWNWLPAFRAVADTEHLPTAGKMMSVSGPALSRSIKNLEASLGRELFNRGGRSIELNADGQRLAEAMRIAMRTVHSAIEDIKNETLSGSFRWTSTWNASLIAISAVEKLIEEHPKIEPKMLNFEPSTFVGCLHRGEVDLVLTNHGVDIEGIYSTLVFEQKHSVFCSSDHPLVSRENLTLEDLADAHFAAPIQNENGGFADGWPADYPRKVRMQFTHMESGYQACLAGYLLAVLPNNAARGLVPILGLETRRQIYAIHRKTLSEGPAEHMVRLLKNNLV